VELDTSQEARWLSWDQIDLVDGYVEAELEDQKAHPELRDEIKTEEQIRTETWEDQEFFTMAWEGMLEILTEWMGDDTEWHCEVENFGWRSLNGEKDFQADDGSTLLCETLPDTNCTFNIWKGEDPKRLRIQNFHHDSATGREWYTLTVRTE